MKPRFSKKRNSGMTLFEVGVVIAVVMILAVVLWPVYLATKHLHSGISCANNVKQISLTYRVWAGDNGDKYPMAISVANGGTMELVATGNVVQTFLVMSNELSTPKILYCSWDTAHTPTSSFAGLANSNISYFVGADVTNDTNPRALLVGDDNFEIGGVPVKPGLAQFTTNSNIAWTSERHISYKEHFWTRTHRNGNIGLADGSVQQVISEGLQSTLQQTGLATNRLAIP